MTLTLTGWTIAFCVLQVLDGLTTYHALSKPGRKEGNPLVRKVMEKIGVVPALVLLKGFGCAFILLYPWRWELVAMAVVAYAFIVLHNFMQVKNG